MMNIENYKKALESMSKEELLNEISNLISDSGIQLQDKCNEIQELKSSLARADLQLQFQIGEVALRDKEIESLEGKRKPEDNEVLNILNNFSELAYKEGCANDVLKVVDYINWQKAEIERLTEKDNEKNERSPFLMCEDYAAYLESMSKMELLEYFHFVMGNYKHSLDKVTLENANLQKQVDELTVKVKSLDCTDMFKEAYISQLKEESKQAVKDIANKVYKIVDDEYYKGGDWLMCRVRGRIKIECGVEVE